MGPFYYYSLLFWFCQLESTAYCSFWYNVISEFL